MATPLNDLEQKVDGLLQQIAEKKELERLRKRCNALEERAKYLEQKFDPEIKEERFYKRLRAGIKKALILGLIASISCGFYRVLFGHESSIKKLRHPIAVSLPYLLNPNPDSYLKSKGYLRLLRPHIECRRSPGFGSNEFLENELLDYRLRQSIEAIEIKEIKRISFASFYSQYQVEVDVFIKVFQTGTQRRKGTFTVNCWYNCVFPIRREKTENCPAYSTVIED